MEYIGLINRIKSNYILKNIFKYITEKNFKLKLFIYPKSNQNRLDLELDYQEIYLKEIGFNLDNYLYTELYICQRYFR